MRNRLPLVLVLLLLGLTAAVLALFLMARSQALAQPLPVLGQVAGFQFTNQVGRLFDTASLRGRPWVADLIFTRCAGPCPKLTQNLAVLQERTLSQGLTLVTLTADPDYDTAPVLKTYAERFQADASRWHFLTGPRAEINRVAMQQLLLAVSEKEPSTRENENDLFLHSTKWVLVDGRGQLRAVYEGTDPASVGGVLRDLRRLEREGGL